MRQLLATFRHRPVPLVGTFVALAIAALTVTWAFSLGEAGGSSTVPAQRLAGAAAVVIGEPDLTVATGPGSTATVPLTAYRRVPSTLATRLARLAGVKAAVAERSVPVALELAGGRVVTGTSAQPIVGYGWTSAVLAPFALRAGHPPVGSHELVVGRGLAERTGLSVGSRVRLVGRDLPAFTVTGIAAAPGHDPTGGSTVFFSYAEAAALYGHPGEADLVGVVAEPGTSPARLAAQVRHAVAGDHLSVLTGAGRGKAEDLDAARQLATLSALGAGAGMVLVLISLFVVASTVALSVAERARTTALLRAVGATSGQVRRQVMAELAAVGALAGVTGWLPGTWLASFSVRGLAAHGLVPSSTRPWTGAVELVPAVLAGVGVAELSGVLAARRASRIRPAAALQEATVERRTPRPLRLVLGLGALGGGGVLSVVALRQPDPSQQLVQAELVLLACMGGVALLGPYLMLLAEMVLRLPLRLLGRAPGRLAAAELRTRVRRMAAAVVAIALPVTFAGAVSLIDATASHGSVVQGRQRLAATAVVTAPGPGLDPSAVAAIRARPGVSGVVGLVPTTVVLPSTGLDAMPGEAVTPGPVTSLLHLGVTAGSLSGFGPGDVALSQLVAGPGAMNVRVGQVVTVHLADGTPYRATVTAVYSRALGFATVLVPTGAAGGGHLGASTVGEVLVGASPGTTPAQLAERLAALAGRYPGLRVASRGVVNAQSTRLTSQTTYANDLLLWLIGLLAGVALVNTLVVATLQGRDELALLRRVGATARQLLAKAACQAAAAVLVGVLLGAASAAVPLLGVSRALTGAWLPHVTWPPVVTILGLVVLLAGVAVVTPTAGMAKRLGET